MKKNNIKAIILVAGEGTRLHPYTLDRPKCMVEVEGVSLIDRQLAVLKSEGVNNIVMIGGYKSEMLQRDDSTLRENTRYFETNMVWTLFCAEEDLDGDILICYGDIVYSKEILQALLKSNSDIAVTIDLEWESYWRARNENPLDDAETLKMHSDGTIYEIGKKPKLISEIEGQYMGLIKLNSSGVTNLKNFYHKSLKSGKLLGKNIENAYMTDLLQAMIDANIEVQSIPISGGWIEVDTVDDLHSDVTKKRLTDIQSGLILPKMGEVNN